MGLLMTAGEALEAAETGAILIIGEFPGRGSVYRKLYNGLWVMVMDENEDYTWYCFSIASLIDNVGAKWSLS